MYNTFMPPKKNPTNFIEAQKKLNEEIKTQSFENVYLIYGEQDYLRTQNRDKIQAAILGDGDAMNSSYFTGDSFTIQELKDLADTLPFFAERRVIVVENSWLFAKGGDTDPLTEYLEKLPETTHLIFVEPNVNRTTRLYKAIAKIGFVLPCETPDEDTLRAWTAARFQKAGHRITNRALALFLDDVGDDMLNIQNESDKLMAFCMDRQDITEEDVKAVCSVRVKDRIFDMIAAIAARNAALAMEIYMELLKLQTPPQVILSLMVKQYNQLLQVKELADRNMSSQDIAQATGMNPWGLNKKILPSLNGQNSESLIAALNDCVQADYDYKNGKIDPQLITEELIVKHTVKRR